MFIYPFRALCVVALVGVLVNGHSWVEEAIVIDENGLRSGSAGYARNNGSVSRRKLHVTDQS